MTELFDIADNGRMDSSARTYVANTVSGAAAGAALSYVSAPAAGAALSGRAGLSAGGRILSYYGIGVGTDILRQEIDTGSADLQQAAVNGAWFAAFGIAAETAPAALAKLKDLTRKAYTQIGTKTYAFIKDETGSVIIGKSASLTDDAANNTAKGAGKNASQLSSKPLYRTMSEGELNAVKETGVLRGGRPGETFFTDSYYKNASSAQNRLSLPSKPDYIMEFKITNNPNISGGTTVKPNFGGLGGGREYFTTDPISVEIINYQKMIK